MPRLNVCRVDTGSGTPLREARRVDLFGTRLFQTGYVYHYAFTMIIGLFVLMTLWINRA